MSGAAFFLSQVSFNPGAMRLISNAPDLLILRHRPWALFIALLVLLLMSAKAVMEGFASSTPTAGIPFVFAMLLVLTTMWLMVQPSRLVADAEAGTLEVLKITLLGRRRIVFDLSDVGGARCFSTRPAADSMRQSWLSIRLDRGDMKGWHRVTAFAPFSNPCRAADYVDAWIKAYHAG